MNIPNKFFAPMLASEGLFSIVKSWDENGNIKFHDQATEEQRQKVADLWLRREDPTFAPVIKQQTIDAIAQIETTKPITPRMLRESLLDIFTALNIPLDSSPGVSRIKEVEDRIAALRSQMPK